MIERDFRYLREKFNDAGATREFEKVCFQLLDRMKQEQVHMVRVSQGDKGIDIFHGEFGTGINVYQCKFFLDNVSDNRRESIRKSFRTVIRNKDIKINSWTLCLPCDLSINEWKWWENWKKKQENNYEISICLYDGKFLLAKLKEFHLYNEVFDLQNNEFEEIINSIYEIPVSKNPFQYNCVTFHGIAGREKELSILRDFLNCKKQVSFWVISGPAGVGKSKLTYYLAQSEQFSYEWKFKFITSYNKKTVKQIAELHSWIYEGNLCLIIDYANELVDYLENWLKELFATKKYSTEYKMRIIFIAREGTKYTHYYENSYPEWFNMMTHRSELLLKNMYSLDFLELRGLEAASYSNIIDLYCRACEKKELTEGEKDQIIEYIKESLQEESQCARPLYILFAVDAYLRNKQMRCWNKSELLECVYDKDVEAWEREIGNTDVYNALLQMLMYATIVGVWDLDEEVPEHISVYADKLYETIDNSGVNPCQRWFTILTGRCFVKNTKYILPALTPDLVGEFYVLSRIIKMPKQILLKWISYFVENIEECKDFFTRLIQNYGDDEKFSYVILDIFKSMIEHVERCYISSDNSFFHETITGILDGYVAGFQGSEDPNIYEKLRRLINIYAQKYHEQYKCWAEIEICRLHSNRNNESFNWKKYHFLNIRSMYEQWPDSVPIKKEYISYLGDMIDFSMGAHTVAKDNLDLVTKSYVELLDCCINYNINSSDEDVLIVLLLACIKVIAAANIGSGTYNIAERYTKYVHDLIENIPQCQTLIVCYLENVDIIVRQLAKIGNHIMLRAVINDLEMYFDKFESIEECYKCIWIGVSALTQLIEILCSYNCSKEALSITSLFWKVVEKYKICYENDWAMNRHKESSIDRVLKSGFISDQVKQKFII